MAKSKFKLDAFMVRKQLSPGSSRNHTAKQTVGPGIATLNTGKPDLHRLLLVRLWSSCSKQAC